VDPVTKVSPLRLLECLGVSIEAAFSPSNILD